VVAALEGAKQQVAVWARDARRMSQESSTAASEGIVAQMRLLASHAREKRRMEEVARVQNRKLRAAGQAVGAVLHMAARPPLPTVLGMKTKQAGQTAHHQTTHQPTTPTTGTACPPQEHSGLAATFSEVASSLGLVPEPARTPPRLGVSSQVEAPRKVSPPGSKTAVGHQTNRGLSAQPTGFSVPAKEQAAAIGDTESSDNLSGAAGVSVDTLADWNEHQTTGAASTMKKSRSHAPKRPSKSHGRRKRRSRRRHPKPQAGVADVRPMLSETARPSLRGRAHQPRFTPASGGNAAATDDDEDPLWDRLMADRSVSNSASVWGKSQDSEQHRQSLKWTPDVAWDKPHSYNQHDSRYP